MCGEVLFSCGECCFTDCWSTFRCLHHPISRSFITPFNAVRVYVDTRESFDMALIRSMYAVIWSRSLILSHPFPKMVSNSHTVSALSSLKRLPVPCTPNPMGNVRKCQNQDILFSRIGGTIHRVLMENYQVQKLVV